MSFIKVEVIRNEKEGYDSLQFTARDDTDEARDELDFILSRVCDTSIVRRGGHVPGNTLRIDFKIPDDDSD